MMNKSIFHQSAAQILLVRQLIHKILLNGLFLEALEDVDISLAVSGARFERESARCIAFEDGIWDSL